MVKYLSAATLCIALLPTPGAAQKPPPAPPEETEQTEPEQESPTETESPQVEPTEEGEEAAQTEDDGEVESGDEVERVLTPEEEEIRRKAAEKAAKKEARSEKRAAKEAEEEAKRAEKAARQELQKDERTVELTELGYASIDAERYKDARGQFEKVRELDAGRSFDGDLGLAHVELALGNYAQSVQLAQRAITAAQDNAQKAEALTLAGNATLAARPVLNGDPDKPQPGTEMFLDAALRFFVRAVELAPLEATEALAHLERRFPGGDPEARTRRLMKQYFDQFEGAETQHGRRVAATYLALLSGQPKPGKPIAIVGPVTPPKRLSGERPRLESTEGAPPRRRLAVSFVIQSDGTVSEAKIIGNIPPGMHAGVIATLSSWVFEPARLPDGTAVTAFWLQGVSLSPE